MPGTSGNRLSIGDFNPVLKEGNPAGGGVQRISMQPLGPALVVNGATYKTVQFIAPCNGCLLKELWTSSVVAIAGGTDTLAISNYDKSATTALNVLSTANIDPTTITALTGLQLTLSATLSNLIMDEGDVLNATLVCGTMSTAGEGLSLQVVVFVPDLI